MRKLYGLLTGNQGHRTDGRDCQQAWTPPQPPPRWTMAARKPKVDSQAGAHWSLPSITRHLLTFPASALTSSHSTLLSHKFNAFLLTTQALHPGPSPWTPLPHTFLCPTNSHMLRVYILLNLPHNPQELGVNIFTPIL